MAMRDRLGESISSALTTLSRVEGLDLSVEPGDVHLERPARRDHGDWSTNVALVNV